MRKLPEIVITYTANVKTAACGIPTIRVVLWCHDERLKIIGGGFKKRTVVIPTLLVHEPGGVETHFTTASWAIVANFVVVVQIFVPPSVMVNRTVNPDTAVLTQIHTFFLFIL